MVRAEAEAARFQAEQARLTRSELESVAMGKAEQHAQVLMQIAAVNTASPAHVRCCLYICDLLQFSLVSLSSCLLSSPPSHSLLHQEAELAALRAENARLQHEREDIRRIQEEREQVEHERFLLVRV